MPEVGFDIEVGTPGADPEEWLGEIQSTWLSYEHNPFTRSPFFNEACLLPTHSYIERGSWPNLC